MFRPASEEGFVKADVSRLSPCGDSPRLRSRLERQLERRGVSQSGLPLLFAGLVWNARRSSFPKNRLGRHCECDASRDPHDSLGNHALAQLPGTNGGSSDLAFRELRMGRSQENRRLPL